MNGPTGTLAVVATPIGNLEDITLRALRVLRECDAVVAEDSRRTKALLTAHGVQKPVLSLPAFDERRRIPHLIERLDRGETLALCTDAGTPALSDPGALLVSAAVEAGHRVTPIPGASALTAALAASGLPGNAFCFLGFLPRTPGKLVRLLEQALQEDRTLAFFESPMRLVKTLRIVAPVLGERPVIVARELSKVHETMHRGTAATLVEEFTAHPPRGECTVLIGARA
ncbi:MAG TPA: 16S rRNA (cytidine(1402)-2'-O)-methyltransferase [Candidatus Saccharimonadales bacterium]|nr:16S rRNA (cytidine(1402)-2'-O)-methyltransferase [Candidatus Saccharimonadales bacterium]